MRDRLAFGNVLSNVLSDVQISELIYFRPLSSGQYGLGPPSNLTAAASVRLTPAGFKNLTPAGFKNLTPGGFQNLAPEGLKISPLEV